MHVERCLSIVAFTALGLWSVPVLSQTVTNQAAAFPSSVDFNCPTRPVAVHLNNGATITWEGRDGQACRRVLMLGTGEKFVQLWFAPTFTGAANVSRSFFEQTKPWTLWPLRVGDKIRGRYDGVGSDPGYAGSWLYTTVVEKREKLQTRAGTFDVFVVSRKEEALGGSFKSTLREWYAPEVGVSIKTAYRDNAGSDSTQEAVSIVH